VPSFGGWKSARLRENDVRRIASVLIRVAQFVAHTNVLDVEVRSPENGDPTTTLDLQINHLIREFLPSEGEGWLSEESRDDLVRLDCRRMWIVDPIDGTREFAEGIAEWSVSIALVEDHKAVAGGVLNPCIGELFLGSLETGLRVSRLAKEGRRDEMKSGGVVLVSRREYREGKWQPFAESALTITPMGSIAYRLARVAAGWAEATCTFQPRYEWDVAAGAALVCASGGKVQTTNGALIRFNNAIPRVETFAAFSKHCPPTVPDVLFATRTK